MKIFTVIGARPQFIKAAVVSREINKRSGVTEEIIHTGQHYDKNMSDIFFEEMEIPNPKYNLDVNSMNHGAMTGKMLMQIEEIFMVNRPDIVLVYGDTNSTLAGALAAAKLHIPIAHVEAGLRSFNRRMPEEINRILTDELSDILFCPTDTAITNLKREGYETKGSKVVRCGDVMYDASLYYALKAKLPAGLETKRKKNKFALCTIHRPENTDHYENLEGIFSALIELSKEIDIVLPLHPRTKKKLGNKFNLNGLIILDPVSYFEIIGLLQGASYVITDSGGLQKEAYFFKRPCITLRDQTEWRETLEMGLNRLTGADYDKILAAYDELKSLPLNFVQSLYGEGNSAKIIVDVLQSTKL